jgi:hypothetical protein
MVIITRENRTYREDVVALIYRRKKNHRIAETTKKSKHPIFPFKKISIHYKVDILTDSPIVLIFARAHIFRLFL